MILVSGYFGYGNLGDEAILAQLLTELTSLGIPRRQIVVLSANPKQTWEDHKVRAIYRYDPISLLRQIPQAKLVISGGGSLLQDVTSKRTIPYYLGIMELGLLFGKPVVVYAQGIGPVKSGLFRRWIVKVIRRTKGCTLRDERSARLLEDWGVPSAHYQVTADAVFAKWKRNRYGHNSDEKDIPLLINLRPTKNASKDIERAVQLFTSLPAEYRFGAQFVAMGPGDKELGLILKSRLGALEIVEPNSLKQAMGLFNRASVCIAMRLHAIVFAAISGAVPYGIEYDPKVGAICRQLGAVSVRPEEIVALSRLVPSNKERLARCRASLEERVAEVGLKARENSGLLARVLSEEKLV